MSNSSSRQGMFDAIPDSVGQLGRSSSARLQSSFPSSPINLGKSDKIPSFTRQGVRDWYGINVLRGMANDGGHTFGSVSLNFRNAPDYDDVTVGGGGLPASPWMPNISSPGESNGVNPANQPEMLEDEWGRETPTTPFEGDGSQLSPKASSQKMTLRFLRDFLVRQA